ncbi:MAG: TrmH family RNA methyltransferase [Actinomycetota bacterium]
MNSAILVESPDDPRLEQFRLRERELRPRRVPARATKGDSAENVEPGLFVAEGDLVVERALAAECIPRAALTDSQRPAPVLDRFPADVPVYAASADARRMLTGLGVALDVIALFERPPLEDFRRLIDHARNVIVLEDVDNPTNVGAIVRSAAALGVDGLVLDRNSSDPLARRALRVSMGTAFGLATARHTSVVEVIEALEKAGYVIHALTPDARATDISTVAPTGERVAVVFGSERQGLSHDTLARIASRVRIPMADGIDSLNVAAAAAVACYALIPR